MKLYELLESCRSVTLIHVYEQLNEQDEEGGLKTKTLVESSTTELEQHIFLESVIPIEILTMEVLLFSTKVDEYGVQTLMINVY